TRNLRLTALQEVTFTTDAQGREIAPVGVLLAAPDVVTAGDVPIFSLDDATGGLVQMSLGTSTASYASTRAIGWHHDAVTGIDMALAGNDIVGIIGGAYDPSKVGRIGWLNRPELAFPADERV